jgi:transposase
VIAPLVVRPVNETDIALFPESFCQLTDMADLIGLDLEGTYLNLDAGFDSDANKALIRYNEMTPNIKVNPRGTKDENKLAERRKDFNEEIYKERFTIERTFAWQDVYRRVATSYDRLESTRLGFKYLAYSLINLRCFVGET